MSIQSIKCCPQLTISICTCVQSTKFQLIFLRWLRNNGTRATDMLTWREPHLRPKVNLDNRQMPRLTRYRREIWNYLETTQHLGQKYTPQWWSNRDERLQMLVHCFNYNQICFEYKAPQTYILIYSTNIADAKIVKMHQIAIYWIVSNSWNQLSFSNQRIWKRIVF